MTTADYNTLEETILLFWDTEENYNLDITQQKLIPQFYKKVFLIDTLERMNEVMAMDFPMDQKFLFFVHLNHSQANKGMDTFKASKIKKEYPNLAFFYVSSTSKSSIYTDEKNNTIDVFSYDTIHIEVDSRFIRQTKAMITGTEGERVALKDLNEPPYPKFDYAIITALFEDEFEELQKIFNFPSAEQMSINKKVFHVGYLKTDDKIKVIAGVMNETGPVESAVISTMMLDLFKPKYLLMSGVCGGADKFNFGDIIVAKKVFAFQKGKISTHPSLLDLLNEDEESGGLFDNNGNAIDIVNIYDKEKKRVAISVEKFELEHDAIINLDTAVEDKLKLKLKDIQEKINKQIKEDWRFNTKIPEIKIAVEPMASGTMVINKKGYFDEIIKAIDRKTAAVEMESYGLARACQFGNDGKTIPIIFKSVMDHTYKKEDAPGGTNVKKFAAYTSALFMKSLFENKVI